MKPRSQLSPQSAAAVLFVVLLAASKAGLASASEVRYAFHFLYLFSLSVVFAATLSLLCFLT